MKKVLAVLSLGALFACGGGNSGTSSTPVAVTPTPAPVNYGGLYKGTMTDNFSSALMRYDAELSITHNAGSVNSEFLLLTSAFGTVTRYPHGSATVTTGQYAISGAYNSTGCGRVSYNIAGRYSGDGAILNLTYTGDTDSCGHFDMRGELRR